MHYLIIIARCHRPMSLLDIKEVKNMSSITPKEIGKQNVKKTQVSWRSKLAQTHARSQPEGKERAKPGSTEKGEYYHVEIRPREEFTRFRTYVNEKTGIQRVAGRHKT